MIQVGNYRPSPDHCCEACVFGRGEHEDWCARARYAVLVEELPDRVEKAMDYTRRAIMPVEDATGTP